MVNKLFLVPIKVTITPPIPAKVSVVPVAVKIIPEETPAQTIKLTYPLTVNVAPIQINLSEPIIKSATNFINAALERYVDEDRDLKTLLNYGEDRQSVVLAYRPGATPKSLQLKLLQPVPDDVELNHKSFLVREVVSSVIDKFRVRFAPLIDDTPYLRPLNASAQVVDLGKHLKNVTLRKLALDTGSFGSIDETNNVSFEDQIIRKWYSNNFNSAELNIDFTDYKNFVFYGSAELRLESFRQKLIQLETLDAQRLQFSGSIFTGSLASAGATYILNQSAELAKKKESIIRGFDVYEQYLYFTPSGSNSPYSASFDYVDGGIEYNSIGYWPKQSNGNLYGVYSSEGMSWIDAQKEIAARYDEYNLNNLVNTIPMHVREEVDNTAYITFVSMIGHFFDTIKPYIDQFPYINSRYIDPNEEISKDLINEVAESLGFRMPTINSIYNLSDTILGTQEDAPRRDYTAETYKRILHNLPFFAKAKGTKSSLNSLLRSLGISPQLISIKESGVPTTSSYALTEEFSTGIDFARTQTSYIQVPLSASLRSPQTLQINASFALQSFMTLLTGDDKWALRLRPNTSNTKLGRLEISSGSTNVLIGETSYHNIYDDELINITIQTNPTESKLQLIKVENEDISFVDGFTLPTTFNALWNNTQYVYVGGSGSLRLGGYDGTLDEVRLWGINLNDSVVTSSAFNPGANFGNTYSDARDSLYVQVSLNNQNISGSYVKNESPYYNKTATPSLDWLYIENTTTGSLSRYSRVVKQNSIILGPSAYITNKIHVLSEPVFTSGSISSDGVSKLLSPRKSIVQPQQKKLLAGHNKITLSMSPTEIINQNIIRNIGYENINRVLGLPSNYYRFDLSLDKLKNYYERFYAIDVNINQYIRLLSDVSSVVDQTVDYFIPAKATVLKGITIEPNILEKIRISSIKNIRGYGATSRKTLNAAGSLTGSRADYGATFNLKQSIRVENTLLPTARVDSLISQIDSPTLAVISSNTNTLKTALSMSSAHTIGAEYNSYTTSIDKKSETIEAISNTFGTNIETDTAQLEAKSPTYKTELNVLTATPDASYLLITSSIVQKEPSDVSVQPIMYTSSGIDLYNEENIIKFDYSTLVYQHVPWEEYKQYEGQNDLRPDKMATVDMRLTSTNRIKFNSTNKGSPGAEPYNRVYTRKLFDYEINSVRNGGVTSLYNEALYDIQPIADFRDIGVTTYFNNEDGVYTFPVIQKSPVYPKPLNQVWNNDTQEFVSASTWTYGTKYSTYDVVYQEVLPTDLDVGDLYESARAGNGRYYVFTTRPSYTTPTDGSAYYLGQVPSYLPPSLDNVNWQLLKFKPIEVRKPRRVVYDTFRNPIPADNNFRTTTIAIDRPVNIPDRYVDTLTIPAIPASSQVVGEFFIQNIFVLFALETSAPNLRVRFYRTQESRDADLARPVTSTPTGSHGVLLDATLAIADALVLSNPIPVLVAGNTPPGAIIYYTIDNVGTSFVANSSLLLYYYSIQPEPRIPFGYLRKHYRFYRDNTTAVKRRNWLGCKNTEETTIDGEKPIQVIISEGNTLTVAQTSQNEEIKTGGGGTLDVA